MPLELLSTSFWICSYTMGNSLIFPAPTESRVPVWMEKQLYFCNKLRKDDDAPDSSSGFLFFCCSDRRLTKKIPYLYFKEDTNPKKGQYLMIFFHTNSENLTHTYKTLERFHTTLEVTLLNSLKLTRILDFCTISGIPWVWSL